MVCLRSCLKVVLGCKSEDGACSWQEFPCRMFPGRRAHSSPRWLEPVEASCRASALLAGLSGKAFRARLVGQSSSGKAERE
ncbi:hypothetical protein FF1_026669 [Malus domestica]